MLYIPANISAEPAGAAVFAARLWSFWTQLQRATASRQDRGTGVQVMALRQRQANRVESLQENTEKTDRHRSLSLCGGSAGVRRRSATEHKQLHMSETHSVSRMGLLW